MMVEEDHHAALDDVQLLLEAHPDLDLARLRRGEIMMSLGEWKEAESNFRDVLSRRGKNPHALIQLAASLIAQERLTEAEQPLNEAIKLDGKSAEGWYQRGLLYESFGQFKGALSDFETAARRDRHHMNALLRIAAIHHSSEDWDNAEVAWRDVLNVEPENRIARRRIQEAIDGQSATKKAAVLTTNTAATTVELESIVTEEVEVEPVIQMEIPMMEEVEVQTIVEVEEPVVEEVEFEETISEEVEEEAAPIEIEIPALKESDTDKPRGTAMDWVDGIELYINEHGGVVNQDFKKLGLIPEDITTEERTRMNYELQNCFTKHKLNNFRIFYCSPTIVDPVDIKAQYEMYEGQGITEVDKEDFEFGFGPL
tara:strand:+ start:57 stop:1163 length:1107 start_codon:yes stop_codon:yes gene_type:complete